ncbi:hypothetical protein PWT90_11253 [Aphanocladium album]|nr:hypothetical protein PWT90_11253 [Aphanocladium album]
MPLSEPIDQTFLTSVKFQLFSYLFFVSLTLTIGLFDQLRQLEKQRLQQLFQRDQLHQTCGIYKNTFPSRNQLFRHLSTLYQPRPSTRQSIQSNSYQPAGPARQLRRSEGIRQLHPARQQNSTINDRPARPRDPIFIPSLLIPDAQQLQPHQAACQPVNPARQPPPPPLGVPQQTSGITPSSTQKLPTISIHDGQQPKAYQPQGSRQSQQRSLRHPITQPIDLQLNQLQRLLRSKERSNRYWRDAAAILEDDCDNLEARIRHQKYQIRCLRRDIKSLQQPAKEATTKEPINQFQQPINQFQQPINQFQQPINQFQQPAKARIIKESIDEFRALVI